MMVKICGITNREDALAAVEAGAGAIGLNFYRESPRYISPTGAATITANLPREVLKVGIFVDESPETITKIALQAGLDVAQLHGTSACLSLPAWRAVNNEAGIVRFDAEHVEAFLFDTPSDFLYGGTGVTFPWEIARGASLLTTKKIIIAGGLDETNVGTAIAEARPWGVDVCSRIEIEPGRKDHVRMRMFIQAALAAQP
jgi:phosphoribosylanthranilate isomerase